MTEAQSEHHLSHIAEDDATYERARRSPPASHPSRWWIALGALAVAGVVAVFWWRQQVEPAPAAPPSAAPTPEAVPPKAEPAIRHPIEDVPKHAGLAQPGAQTQGAPALADSDSILRDALAGMIGAGVFERFVNPQDLARRFVATVDNLPRASVAAQVNVLRPVEGTFSVAGRDGNLTIGADNASRYTALVRVATALDTSTVVALYVKHYPWFQQAYAELGYPSGYFNDRLVDVIDNLLAAPDVGGSVALVQPRVLYRFADPRLEALPAGQKMMIRMGSENAAQVKAKLRELRRALTGALPPP